MAERNRDDQPETTSGLPAWQADAHLDARGLICPLPVLKARKALSKLRPGERLMVETTDPVARIDLPHFCTESGHLLIAQDHGPKLFRFLIECGSLSRAT